MRNIGQKSIMIAFLFFMLIFFSGSVKAYDLKWDANTTTNKQGEKVVRVKMSAGASEKSIEQWNTKDKYNVNSSGYNTEKKGFECGDTTNYSSEYTTFHAKDELTTTYYENPPARRVLRKNKLFKQVEWWY